MGLSWLYATGFRNLNEARLELSPGLNLVHGENGSGKTSLLEAAYFLGSARSFRTSLADPLIQRGADQCLVRGESDHSGVRTQFGIQRKRGAEREIHINGETCNRTSDLARLLPTQVLGPESLELLLGPPALRRRFLNWGLFHVKHSSRTGFTELWEEANRCLRQRNRVLREGRLTTKELEVWSHQLAAHANKLDEHRQQYIDAYQGPFQAHIKEIARISDVRLQYYRGWDRDSDLRQIYEKEALSDQKRGFTQKGFQRADVRITVNGQPAVKVCSRGELKALVWSMILAQGAMADYHESNETLYLIDDLASEFDQEHRRRLGTYLYNSGSQVIITGVDEKMLIDCCDGRFENMFHVKHGQVLSGQVAQEK